MTEKPWRWDGAEPRSLLDGDGFVILSNDMIDLPDAKTLALIAAAPELLEVLRSVEWSSQDDWGSICPSCQGGEHAADGDAAGHRGGCKLAALLERLK